jgi:lysophospholipase L1-like esterase
MTVKQLEVRMTAMEKTVEILVEKFKLMEVLERRVLECEKKCMERIDEDSTGKVSILESNKREELLNRIAVCEVSNEDRMSKLESQVTEIGDKAVALGLRFEEFKAEYPTPLEEKELSEKVRSAVNNGRSSKPRSCNEVLRSTKDSVLVLGDSIARGVGEQLRSQSDKVFEQRGRGGATIDSVTEGIAELKDDSNRHLVVIAGTNNLERDSTADILIKYDKLLDKVMKVKHRKVTVVGIVKRYDLGRGFESKRIVVNMKLKEKCKKANIAFLGYDPERRQLGRDKLHLNEDGQNVFAGKIFRHCVAFLG